MIRAASVYGGAIATIGFGTILTSAFAATQIQQHGEELEVQAENASIKEILDALSGHFNVSYNQSSAVSRVLTGRFSGTLQQVLARVLAGNDYVLGTSDDTVRIVILNRSSVIGVAAAEQRPAADGEATAAPPPVPRTPSLTKPVPSLSSYLR
jgi:hypothetical protein